MTKNVFIIYLKTKLSTMPEKEREERLSFYREMIDDRIEEGMTEVEAVASVGKIDDIVRDILAEQQSTGQEQRPRTKKRRKAWEIVLLVLGSPLWIVLLATAFVVVLSLFISLWSIVASLWAVTVALPVASIGSLGACLMSLFEGNFVFTFVMLGISAFCAGLFVFAFFGVRYVTKGAWFFTKKTMEGIVHSFYRKEDKQ